VSLVEIPALAISSTDCRERVAKGRPVRYLVPDGVVQYIAKHHLYPRTSALDPTTPDTTTPDTTTPDTTALDTHSNESTG
jgi:nicotinate-nucleotide adenylyltransferase